MTSSMTPERALEHDERCERFLPVSTPDTTGSVRLWCRCAERALARAREEIAKLQVAMLADGIKAQAEITRLTLAASESARTLQVRIAELEAGERHCDEYHGELADQVTALREALIEIRRLQVKNWSDNPDWRNGAEHTWSGQMDIVAEKALAFFQDGA